MVCALPSFEIGGPSRVDTRHGARIRHNRAYRRRPVQFLSAKLGNLPDNSLRSHRHRSEPSVDRDAFWFCRLAAGIDKLDAIIDAGASRLRPVALAAATMVLGLLPLLPDVFWIGLSVTLIGGLTAGTVLTMVMALGLYATFHGVKS